MINATCKYCNQKIMIDEDEISKLDCETADEAAVMKCKCNGAVARQRYVKRKKRTMENIELAFHNPSEAIEDLMKAAVKPLLGNRIAKITIDNGHGFKGTMSLNSKGEVKVKASATKEAEYIE